MDDRVALLADEEPAALTDWLRLRTKYLWRDVRAWGLFLGRWLLVHWPLGPVRAYPPTESANFSIINNEKTRLIATARKKREGAWRVGLRWLCLILLGISVAALYQFMRGSMNYLDEVG